MRFVAEFIPQAWIKDSAIEVDPIGPTTWEPAEVPEPLRGEAVKADGARVLDIDDALREDENAPEWVRQWHGPFTIQVWIEG